MLYLAYYCSFYVNLSDVIELSRRVELRVDLDSA